MLMNVDQRELEKLAASADEWWNLTGRFRALHWEHPVRLRYLEGKVQLGSKRVLDVGCGGGLLAESMAARGAQVTAIDLAEPLLAAARRHSRERGLKIDYRLLPVEELAELEPAQFDVVTCVEMLEHVPRPASIISACAQLVKADGWVFLSTFNRSIKSYLLATSVHYYCWARPVAPEAEAAS
jgi:2-polyprenyl-6-hydroxyphenyl methylase/3-demethylubiquinone-9 3-methyltransferase